MKTFDAEWKHFLKLSYDGHEIGRNQHIQLKRAFYAGAMTALTKCVEASTAKTEAEGAKQVGKMMGECMATCEELAKCKELAGMKIDKLENN